MCGEMVDTNCRKRYSSGIAYFELNPCVGVNSIMLLYWCFFLGQKNQVITGMFEWQATV